METTRKSGEFVYHGTWEDSGILRHNFACAGCGWSFDQEASATQERPGLVVECDNCKTMGYGVVPAQTIALGG